MGKDNQGGIITERVSRYRAVSFWVCRVSSRETTLSLMSMGSRRVFSVGISLVFWSTGHWAIAVKFDAEHRSSLIFMILDHKIITIIRYSLDVYIKLHFC